MFTNIAIIGLGLIGSSIAYDIRAHRLAKHVIGIDPVREHGDLLLTRGVIHESVTDIAHATTPCDLIIIASPPSSFASIAAQLSPLFKAGTLMMDVGSVKAHAIDAIAPHIPAHVTYLPAHPIAGKAESGASAGEEGLFSGKRIILTPYQEVNEAVVTLALDFWQGIGGACEIMDAQLHDQIYAHVSHLPQMVAFASCLTLNEIPRMAVPTKSIHNFLRLGASSPALWTDIATHNRTHLHDALHTFLYLLNHMIAELSSGQEREEPTREAKDAALTLLPRIIASLVISTVIMFEKKHDIKAITYVGSGFADVTAPAMEAPDADIERISGAYAQVAQMLKLFEGHFRTLFLQLERGETKELFDSMVAANLAHKHLVQTLH